MARVRDPFESYNRRNAPGLSRGYNEASKLNRSNTRPAPGPEAKTTKSRVGSAMSKRGGQNYRTENPYSRIARGMRGR